ncbi:MAG: nuclear transport factor 2 family protein [Ignavibacteriaceae bacterium]
MKKTIRLSLFIIFSLMVFGGTLIAQNHHKEMLKLTKKYEDAYNRKDDKAIKALYKMDATMIGPGGHISNGSEDIRAALKRDFSANDSTTKIVITIESEKIAADNTIIVKGNKIKSGLPFEFEGPYTNFFVKEKGKWKIFKTSYTADLNIND